MDWSKGKSTGNRGCYHQLDGFPIKKKSANPLKIDPGWHLLRLLCKPQKAGPKNLLNCRRESQRGRGEEVRSPYENIEYTGDFNSEYGD